jgi:tetratricopeptide (TPR) repeat protein
LECLHRKRSPAGSRRLQTICEPSRKGKVGQGNTDAAIADFDKAIVAAPRSSFAYLNRGLAFQKRGDQDKALADLDKAVRYAPSAARTYYNRSILLRERGDVKRADADLQRAVDLDGRYRSLK